MFQLMDTYYALVRYPTSASTWDDYNEPTESISNWNIFYGVVTEDNLEEVQQDGKNCKRHNRTYYAFFPNLIFGQQAITQISNSSSVRTNGAEFVETIQTVPGTMGYYIIKTRQVTNK